MCNRLVKLKDEDGTWVSEKEVMNKLILDHFQNLFTSSQDDSYLFFRACESEAYVVHYILKEYELAFGQAINLNKSTINFSGNVKEDDRVFVSHILQVQTGMGQSSYLGFPSLIGRNKREIMGFIKEKITSRLNNWNNRFLSKAGKVVLLKSIIQAIPTYAMFVFLLPKTLCEEIQILMNGYWWGNSGREGKGIRWMSWEKMCCPKQQGGMGFRKLREFNIAMLGKQLWRLATNPDSLVGRLFKAKYYPKSNPLMAELENNPSFIWRSIWEARDVVKRGCRWKIRDGKSINI